jgi:hypothetical protein
VFSPDTSLAGATLREVGFFAIVIMMLSEDSKYPLTVTAKPRLIMEGVTLFSNPEFTLEYENNDSVVSLLGKAHSMACPSKPSIDSPSVLATKVDGPSIVALLKLHRQASCPSSYPKRLEPVIVTLILLPLKAVEGMTLFAIGGLMYTYSRLPTARAMTAVMSVVITISVGGSLSISPSSRLS